MLPGGCFEVPVKGIAVWLTAESDKRASRRMNTVLLDSAAGLYSVEAKKINQAVLIE
jgi:hypothetical protein